MGSFRNKVEERQRELGTLMAAEKRALEIFKRGKQSALDKRIENRNTFLERGKLYSFNYQPIDTSALSYYDKNPLVLVLDRKQTEDGKLLDIGINLNFVPFEVKISLLDRMVEAYKILIKGNTFIAPNRANAQTRLPINWNFAKRILGPAASVAIRSYYTNRRSNTYCFSYESWSDLAFLNVEDIEGATLNEIYRLRRPKF